MIYWRTHEPVEKQHNYCWLINLSHSTSQHWCPLLQATNPTQQLVHNAGSVIGSLHSKPHIFTSAANSLSQNDKYNINKVLYHLLSPLVSIKYWLITAMCDIWVSEALSQASIEANSLGHEMTDPLKNVMSNISTPLHYVLIHLSRLSDCSCKISLVITDEESYPQPAPFMGSASGDRTGLDYSRD